MQKIVHALSASKRVAPWHKVASTGNGYRFEFFKGSNHLGAVHTSDGIFWLGRTPYLDESGSLDTVYAKRRQMRAAE